MGNSSSSVQDPNYIEVQKIKDVLNMDTETYVSQKGRGFYYGAPEPLRVGQRVVELDSNVHGVVTKIDNTMYSGIPQLFMRGDDGQTYQHHTSHYVAETDYNKTSAAFPTMAAPRSLTAKFNIGDQVSVTGNIGILRPVIRMQSVVAKRGIISYVDTTAPIGKVIYNVDFEDGTVGEVWEEYINPVLSASLAAPQTSRLAPMALPIAASSYRTHASSAAYRPAAAASSRPAASSSRLPTTASSRLPTTASGAFDAVGYCSAVLASNPFPDHAPIDDMTPEQIQAMLCAAVMKK